MGVKKELSFFAVFAVLPHGFRGFHGFASRFSRSKDCESPELLYDMIMLGKRIEIIDF